jgi:hypothetical protein
VSDAQVYALLGLTARLERLAELDAADETTE